MGGYRKDAWIFMDFAVNGTTVYLATTYLVLIVLDVSNPRSITAVARYFIAAPIKNQLCVTVSDGKVYVASYGLHIFEEFMLTQTETETISLSTTSTETLTGSDSMSASVTITASATATGSISIAVSEAAPSKNTVLIVVVSLIGVAVISIAVYWGYRSRKLRERKRNAVENGQFDDARVLSDENCSGV
eukprot:TRINITY_DN4429_c1_g1_i1.p2 TRINITY_DN4429_c1_g1~~TRINITY_DN4429_c1_g1_i1.p2  ORF type:complete len:189 (+),score=25.59 TRINITY_DN4429_c1_g1_i1:1865-2431(+)